MVALLKIEATASAAGWRAVGNATPAASAIIIAGATGLVRAAGVPCSTAIQPLPLAIRLDVVTRGAPGSVTCVAAGEAERATDSAQARLRTALPGAETGTTLVNAAVGSAHAAPGSLGTDVVFTCETGVATATTFKVAATAIRESAADAVIAVARNLAHFLVERGAGRWHATTFPRDATSTTGLRRFADGAVLTVRATSRICPALPAGPAVTAAHPSTRLAAGTIWLARLARRTASSVTCARTIGLAHLTGFTTGCSGIDQAGAGCRMTGKTRLAGRITGAGSAVDGRSAVVRDTTARAGAGGCSALRGARRWLCLPLVLAVFALPPVLLRIDVMITVLATMTKSPSFLRLSVIQCGEHSGERRQDSQRSKQTTAGVTGREGARKSVKMASVHARSCSRYRWRCQRCRHSRITAGLEVIILEGYRPPHLSKVIFPSLRVQSGRV